MTHRAVSTCAAHRARRVDCGRRTAVARSCANPRSMRQRLGAVGRAARRGRHWCVIGQRRMLERSRGWRDAWPRPRHRRTPRRRAALSRSPAAERRPGLRCVLSGGDPRRAAAVVAYLACRARTQLIALYGPTETTHVRSTLAASWPGRARCAPASGGRWPTRARISSIAGSPCRWAWPASSTSAARVSRAAI